MRPRLYLREQPPALRHGGHVVEQTEPEKLRVDRCASLRCYVLESALGSGNEVEERDLAVLPDVLHTKARNFLGTTAGQCSHQRYPSLRASQLGELGRGEDGREVGAVVRQPSRDAQVITSNDPRDALERVRVH